MDSTTARDPITIQVPGYDPTRHHAGLIRRIHDTYGPDARLCSVNPATAEAVVGWGSPPLRPGAVVARLGDDVRPTQAVEVEARARRIDPTLSLVEWSPEEGVAVFARLDAETVRVRQRVAEFFRVADRPWLVELAIEWVWDTEDEIARMDVIHVERTPAITPLERRREVLREIATEVVGGPGWTVEDDPSTIQATLRHGPPPALPALVPLTDVLPERPAGLPGDDDEWSRIPVGVGVDGERIFWDLLATPHGVATGQTGAGKTVALNAIIASALVAGHRVVVVDPTKAGLDFAPMRPWMTAWGCADLETAAAVLQRCYDEVARRKPILEKHLAVKWSDLPSSVRAEHDIVPVTVVIDEVSSLLIAEKMPTGLPKDHPVAEAAADRIAARAIIRDLLGRIARESRFAGLAAIVGVQRPDADVLSGELRSNLGFRLQMSAPGSPPSREAIAMVMPPDVVADVQDVITALDDGHSKGLGIVAAEGGRTLGCRIAFAAPTELAPILESRGVPLPTPWEIETDTDDDYDPPPKRQQGNQAKAKRPAPSVEDLFEDF